MADFPSLSLAHMTALPFALFSLADLMATGEVGVRNPYRCAWAVLMFDAGYDTTNDVVTPSVMDAWRRDYAEEAARILATIEGR